MIECLVFFNGHVGHMRMTSLAKGNMSFINLYGCRDIVYTLKTKHERRQKHVILSVGERGTHIIFDIVKYDQTCTHKHNLPTKTKLPTDKTNTVSMNRDGTFPIFLVKGTGWFDQQLAINK